MKKMIFVLSVIVFFTAGVQAVVAQDETIQNDEFAIEILYKHFESHYTPRDLLHKAQTEAMYIAGEFKKSKEAGKKAIDEFNKPFTRWNTMDGLSPFSQIHNTEKGWVEAHPNPGLHKMRYIENLAQKFKDHAGRTCVFEGHEKLKNQPKGVWIFQFSTFIKSRTKISTPYYTLNVFVSIPGTPYNVNTIMPYRGYSIKEMDKTVEYLDSMVQHWSIME